MPTASKLPYPMSESFQWPMPPYFSSIYGHSHSQESCLIVLLDGKKMLGTLSRFLPEENVIEFLANRATVNTSLTVDQLLSIRLVSPLQIKKMASALEIKGEEIYPASEKQPFTVDFVTSEKFTGETIGFVNRKEGLYLFLPNDSGNVVRCFVPAKAMKNYQIGVPIGQMLIEENIATKAEVEAGLEKQQQLRTQRIGDYLTANQIVTPEQLARAIKVQKSAPQMKLGEALIQENLISQAQLEEALVNQQKDRKIALGEILVNMGVVDKDSIKRTLARKLGIQVVNLHNFNIDMNVIKLVPERIVQKYSIMPLCYDGTTLMVAVENPMNWEPLEQIRFFTKLNVEPVMASVEDIAYAINRFYGSSFFEQEAEQTASENNNGLTADSDAELGDEAIVESDNVLVKFVNKMILDAFQQHASDIHIETYPGRGNTRIRFRKDGTLVKYQEVPSNFRKALVSRIKIMAQLDISEKRKPQDGKIDFRQFGPAQIELRVATIPTSNGIEDVVMRLLAGAKPIPLDNIGLRPESAAQIKELAEKSYGLFLICGPTGSGKTTTLHSILAHINTPERKIWTAEDPIEITQEGLRQVQVNPKIDWTFAAAMRAFLRADPDVIMVGEMRDLETAKTGIEASLTGHMVFSTLHTNSAPESVIRLLDLGMDPFNFADALLGVLAQRLAKRHCLDCRQSRTATPGEIDALIEEYCFGLSLEANEVRAEWQNTYADSKGEITLFSAKGCNKCDQTGYRGRLGLHELLINSSTIKKQIQNHATVAEILATATTQGMRTLKQDGIEKVLAGHTDILQIRAVCN